MRPVGFVGGEEINVGAERAHVGKTVRRIGDAIDADKRAGVMREPRNVGDGIDLGDDVRRMRETDEAHLAIEQALKPFDRQMPAVAIDFPFANLNAAIGKPAPWP